MGEGDRGAGGKQAENSKSDTTGSHTRGYQPRDLRLANRFEPKCGQTGKGESKGESETCDWMKVSGRKTKKREIKKTSTRRIYSLPLFCCVGLAQFYLHKLLDFDTLRLKELQVVPSILLCRSMQLL